MNIRWDDEGIPSLQEKHKINVRKQVMEIFSLCWIKKIKVNFEPGIRDHKSRQSGRLFWLFLISIQMKRDAMRHPFRVPNTSVSQLLNSYRRLRNGCSVLSYGKAPGSCCSGRRIPADSRWHRHNCRMPYGRRRVYRYKGLCSHVHCS